MQPRHGWEFVYAPAVGTDEHELFGRVGSLATLHRLDESGQVLARLGSAYGKHVRGSNIWSLRRHRPELLDAVRDHVDTITQRWCEGGQIGSRVIRDGNDCIGGSQHPS